MASRKNVETFLLVGDTVWLAGLTIYVYRSLIALRAEITKQNEDLTKLYETVRAQHKIISGVPQLASAVKSIDMEIGEKMPNNEDVDELMLHIEAILAALEKADIEVKIPGSRSYGKPPKTCHRTHRGRLGRQNRGSQDDDGSDDFDPNDIINAVRSRGNVRR